KLLNGVYLDDHVTSGTDAAEMTFTATIGAGAELNVVVAKAGVKGGVEGVLGANLKDNDGDGRVHLDEFVNNLLAGPECIFDFEGALKAFFEAYIKVGLSTPFGFVTLWSDSFKLLDETIVDFNYVTCPPVTPNLFDMVGTFDHDSNAGTAGVNTLVLNAGPRAGNVLEGETTDGDEEFTIDYDSATNQIVVTGYDYEERVSAAGVQAIWFDAGLGNDIITVTALVNIPVWGFGGPGNDKLTGGKAANTLSGDSGSVVGTAGSDKLIGRKAADVLSGNGSNDVILGYGGSDVIDGGDGDDQLYGEDEVGDMVAFIAANLTFEAGTAGADTIRGGAGSDRIGGGDAGDSLYGDTGDDTIDGNAGGDTIEGGEGNDKIYGRDGDDSIWGDDIAGLLTAGAIDVNADLIEGGTGYNVIYGGPGYDSLYAADEDQKATAPSTGTSGGWSSRLSGGDGNDTIYGTAGKDWISGGFDSDYVESGAGDDDLFGGPGGDCLIAAGGNARIFGG
ncbi:MAG: calcium-binding protein, partial [Planctomycetes bacterium]|nr:calcium-binding protein [Planctomycetota bacterium]